MKNFKIKESQQKTLKTSYKNFLVPIQMSKTKKIQKKEWAIQATLNLI